MKRIVIFGLIAGSLWATNAIWLTSRQPETSAKLALKQVNGGAGEARRLREFEMFKNASTELTAVLTLFAAWLCFGSVIRKNLGLAMRSLIRFGHRAQLLLIIPLLCLISLTSGCVKPYDTPEFKEIDTSETGFLIPLEGDSVSQAKFQSEDYLKQRKVAAKRVQITHRWSQEGRFHNSGRWIPTVRLIKVNRSPVTREWATTQTSTAGGATQRADKAIWIESGDSVGFSMGFTCTAFIPEEEASRFLYWYPSGSLADVMDKEVRGRIQQAAAEVATKYPLDSLRSRKQEIADAVKTDVTNFFAARGVVITTVGMFGGMTYENPQIQKAIDDTFVAQQLKVVSEAKFQAQQKENDRLVLEANGIAEKARREAQGEADARKTVAAGEAEAIRVINQAALEAQQNPLLFQLKTLEVEKTRIEKWDGRYPQMWFGAAASGMMTPNLLLQIPSPSTADSGRTMAR
jgi:hypothetical protein